MTSPPADPPRRGRPPRISQEQILDAALAQGLGTFTMQGIADQLGVSSPALYSHVTGREDVLARAGVAVRDRLASFESVAVDWRGWLLDFAHLVRRHLAPSASSLLVDLHGPGTAAQVGIAERGLQLLIDEGLSPAEAGYAVWLVFRVAITAGPEDATSFADFVDETGQVLGPGRRGAPLPATRAVHDALDSPVPHDTFRFDLETVLDGLAHRINAVAAPAGTARPSERRP